ncbi:15214_t:CDS:2, partial [Funneliformis geosporum]
MRQNKELSEKVGLLPGMGIYKFFRVIYGYDGERTYIAQKRKKPLISSQVFINNDYGFTEEVEQEFSDYFEPDLTLKKGVRQLVKKQNLSSRSAKSKKTSSENRATLPKTPLEKKVKGENSTVPSPKTTTPNQLSAENYQPHDHDYRQFAQAAKLPWNKTLNEYEPWEENGE